MKNSIFQRLKSVHYLAGDNRWALWAKEKGNSEGQHNTERFICFGRKLTKSSDSRGATPAEKLLTDGGKYFYGLLSHLRRRH